MNRGLLNVVTLVSLLVWLACAAASVRARWANDEIAWARERPAAQTGRHYRLVTLRNRMGAISFSMESLSIGRGQNPPPALSFTRGWRSSAYRRFTSSGATFRFPGVRYFVDAATGDTTLYLAHWLISLLTLPLPLLVLFRWVGRSKRRSEGKCAACGYDLRHSRGRCPECGTAADDPVGAEAVA